MQVLLLGQTAFSQRGKGLPSPPIDVSDPPTKGQVRRKPAPGGHSSNCAAAGRPEFRRKVRETQDPREIIVADQGPIVSGIAGRYASALFDLAEEAKATDKVGADLASFAELLAGSADLQRLVKNPVFTAGEQTAAVSAVLAKAKIGGLAGNFLKLVASKRRLFAVEGMIRAFHALVDRKNGVVSAEVTVPSALNDKNRAAVLEALKGVTGGKSVSLTEKVDPSIIGGLIVKVGSKMVDASLKTKLNSIKLAMKEVG